MVVFVDNDAGRQADFTVSISTSLVNSLVSAPTEADVKCVQLLESHVTTVQETTENNKKGKTLAGAQNVRPLRRDCTSTCTTTLNLSRHGLCLDSPEAHAWNTPISPGQSKMIRAFTDAHSL